VVLENSVNPFPRMDREDTVADLVCRVVLEDMVDRFPKVYREDMAVAREDMVKAMDKADMAELFLKVDIEDMADLFPRVDTKDMARVDKEVTAAGREDMADLFPRVVRGDTVADPVARSVLRI